MVLQTLFVRGSEPLPMYVREARNRDEAWLLDRIDELGVDEAAFRSRDYVIAVDEETNERAGFGRIRIHKGEAQEYCELTSLGVLNEWRGQGVGAHVVERLVEKAGDEEFDQVYTFVVEPEYYEQFGFEGVSTEDLPEPLTDRFMEKQETVNTDIVPLRLTVSRFRMPDDLRDAFKAAGASGGQSAESEETPEDFGIDPDEATYKYDTGR